MLPLSFFFSFSFFFLSLFSPSSPLLSSFSFLFFFFFSFSFFFFLFGRPFLVHAATVQVSNPEVEPKRDFKCWNIWKSPHQYIQPLNENVHYPFGSNCLCIVPHICAF
ncbi:Uncharacterized protein TCM_033501 [Theobroma cacao]|uniref:Uncharacterized protein n=1 Tax=Theobroma cacao TaxID=3641 RepID=A0A061FA70_THECC|nr:Uncharacterized protein TCM_033501 [Theobroma cacao]